MVGGVAAGRRPRAARMAAAAAVWPRSSQQHRAGEQAGRQGWRCPCRRCRGPSRGPARRCRGVAASGRMLALGAMPMPPASTAARSERMSPNRLLGQQHVERARGLDHAGGHRVDQHGLELDPRVLLRRPRARPGPTAGSRSASRWTWSPGAAGPPRSAASVKAWCAARSMTRREWTATSMPRSWPVPAWATPPAPTYSPSVFSRTITRSTPSVSRTLVGTPGKATHRADVDREVELLAQADDQAPDQLVVGDVRAADGAEQHGVVLPDDVGRVGGHRGALAAGSARRPSRAR